MRPSVSMKCSDMGIAPITSEESWFPAAADWTRRKGDEGGDGHSLWCLCRTGPVCARRLESRPRLADAGLGPVCSRRLESRPCCLGRSEGFGRLHDGSEMAAPVTLSLVLDACRLHTPENMCPRCVRLHHSVSFGHQTSTHCLSVTRAHTRAHTHTHTRMHTHILCCPCGHCRSFCFVRPGRSSHGTSHAVADLNRCLPQTLHNAIWTPAA